MNDIDLKQVLVTKDKIIESLQKDKSNLRLEIVELYKQLAVAHLRLDIANNEIRDLKNGEHENKVCENQLTLNLGGNYE